MNLSFKSTVKGPILSHAESTLNGLTTIRTSQKMQDYKSVFYKKYNNHTAAYFPYVAIKRWFAIRVDLLFVGFVCFVIVSCISLNGNFILKYSAILKQCYFY